MNDVKVLHVLKYFHNRCIKTKKKIGLTYAFYNSEVGKIIINVSVQCQEPCPQV